MDLLRTSVVDITTLVAACHAMKSDDAKLEDALHGKLRGRLRRELKHGTLAYIDVLARTRRGAVDAVLLAKCRLAAESQMPRAFEHQALLGRIMANEAGSLDGLAATRQDLWRLAHLAIHLSTGMANLRALTQADDVGSTDATAGRLRRRLRRAMIAYARATLRTKSPQHRFIVKAREAALAEIGTRGAAQAEHLAEVEARAKLTPSVIRQGVVRPLSDLALDWQRPDPRRIGEQA